MKSTDIQRFQANVNKRGPDECWPWTAFCNERGYGRVKWGAVNTNAHRVSYAIHKGPIPEGMFVLHSCDNPPCCNPSHLHIGTHKDNMRERDERNRNPSGPDHWSRHKPECAARGDRNGARVHPEKLARGRRNGKYTKPEKTPRGEKCGASVLTEAQVRDICIGIAGGATYYSLSKKFPVSRVSIRNIAIGKTWRHVSWAILEHYDQARLN